ncbi:MAG: glycosyltransferase family 4 protein [Candidatus Roizmanbacteria bacterium]|nr:MAG: glycosyltransferase family 4 protein [Candidatus Roizmanbacteria bacterium]
MTPVYVFDPTASDLLSRVRGIGRYLQLLKENFSNEFIFSDKLPSTHNSQPITFINPFFDPLKTPLLMKRIAQKQIAVIHDLIPLKYPFHFPVGIRGKLNIFLNKLALKNYDLIITDSQTSKKDIVNILKVKSEKLKVIYPTLTGIFFDSRSSTIDLRTSNIENRKSKIKDLRSNYLIYVGDATWNKNLVNLTKAIKFANVTCIFVGKIFTNYLTGGANLGIPSARSFGRALMGKNERQNLSNNQLDHPWQKDLKEFLEITQNDKHFIFPGFVKDEELISLYKNAVANILVSRDEGFGFSYFEAASQGTPSILSDISIFHETAADAALFADPNNPQDIADKINELFTNKEFAQKLGNKAKHRTLSFSPKKFKEDLLKIINDNW